MPHDIDGPLLNPASAHALEMAGHAVNHDDPRRFYGYMVLIVAHELAGLRREIRALTHSVSQGVGCLNYIATRPASPTPNFPP